MKIEQSRENHYSYCNELNKFISYSNYTGLGLLWLFYSNGDYKSFVEIISSNNCLLYAILLFLFSIALHLIGNLWSCVYWHFDFRTREVCFYRKIDVNKISTFCKLWYWLLSATVKPLDIDKDISTLENKEYHVRDNVHTVPYIFFYLKIAMTVSAYLLICFNLNTL